MSTERSVIDSSEFTTDSETDGFLSRIQYRKAGPTDIYKCVEMLQGAASANHVTFSSKNELQYRQHYAAPYFRCAVYEDEEDENGEDNIIGFITGIRFEMAENDRKTLGKVLTATHPHDPNGKNLAIRSCAIGEEYRNKGLGKAMMNDYIETMKKITKGSSLKSAPIKPIDKIVGLCRNPGLLPFYLNCGFSAKKADKLAESCSASDKQKILQSAYQLELSLTDPCDCQPSTKNEYKCYIVDSFASKPGTGNPAAVVLLQDDFNPQLNHKWMQKVAAEFNLSETAFCWPKGSNQSNSEGGNSPKASRGSHWYIRYYTPTVEIDLCGHATLASAAVLFQTLPVTVLPPRTPIVFHANEDVLTMDLANDKDTMPSSRTSKVSMVFPSKPPTELSTREDKATVRNMLNSAFSMELKPLYVGLSDIGDLLIELSPEAFAEIGYGSLNFNAFFEWDGYYRGVVICCVATDTKSSEKEGGPKVDFLSRFFGPKAGIDEDPVTGSAHCSLGPYFAQKLKKSTLIGQQMSSRSGIVECEVSSEVVTLTGTAITTMSGKLLM
eukprot:CAMPEP_0116079264 /NCGR_PEP_ID=MMETSP0327-20121206/1050_1 /TAXON_ID=44447 /ORGANISM="Pseudo-nitzschia delicatissima, Strain B596" /LENGTH=552 /DNA_ID=CAMNT_0003569879 /DNA_START=85 /DNA_END=1743 /DNA_ORIENTATION=-